MSRSDLVYFHVSLLMSSPRARDQFEAQANGKRSGSLLSNTQESRVTIRRLRQYLSYGHIHCHPGQSGKLRDCKLLLSPRPRRDQEWRDFQARAAGCLEGWAILGSLGPVLQRPFLKKDVLSLHKETEKTPRVSGDALIVMVGERRGDGGW